MAKDLADEAAAQFDNAQQASNDAAREQGAATSWTDRLLNLAGSAGNTAINSALGNRAKPAAAKPAATVNWKLYAGIGVGLLVLLFVVPRLFPRRSS